ncbi:PREDICTED: muscle M-line assembly protein unc-89-like [Branchiostoma belcheri]|uniref:Muscle M-line assembly protein unc-89-like n=1 Tax=Branchiostoma belcheri TaxID=7741 RepID=A0A6P4ZAK7_BRABE|nr:PREDICTED: muscle M-line assembly protein unc-89-like [Branchiostoma belcheri]
MEKFARDSAEMCQQLDQLEHAVNTQLLSDTIAIGDKFIFQYNHFRRKARTIAVETINFGKELLADLQKFIESGFATDYSKHTEDTVVAVATVKKQLSAVEGRENKLLDLLEEQIREEVYGMQLSGLEKGSKEVVEWILGTGQQMLGSNHRIGQNLTSAESYRKEHEQIQLRCTDVFAKYSELTHKAELLLQEGYGVTDDIKAQRDYMDTVCRNFASRMERRRNLLVSSVKFLRVAQGLSRALDSLLEQVLSDTIPEDVPAAQRAIGRIQEFGDNVEREFKEVMKEGQILMDLLSGLVKDAFGKDVTPDHTRDFQHVKNKLEDLERRKLRCDELGDVRKLRLQQILQLRTCERDADQAVQWLEELCGVMVRTHTDVGKTAGEAGKLKEEHDKFQSTAKSTYDYGKQLLQAALVLRRSCHYNCQPNHLKAVKLEKAWNKFSKCLDERASRLFITHDFHKKADTLLLDMRNLIHSMQLGAAADSLQESAASMIVRRREETEEEYEETMRMGNSLMVRLAMPIMDQTSAHKVAEDTREAIDLVQKKQKQLDVRKKETEDVWKQHQKRLEAPLKIRQLHREMKQSLQDIQLRIADAMPGLLEVGRSLEEAKRLKKQHEDLMGKLKGKQGHVNELLHQADNVVINKEPDLDVYEAMAESLGEAWKDLNAQLEDRRLLLDAAILFHESVKQFTDKLNVAHRLFSPLTLPQDVDIIRMQLQKHHQTKKEILEASMETMNRGQVLLDRMQDMGSHLDSKHATTAACYGVEHMLENLHDRRRHMEEVWALQKLRLEKSLQLCIWKQEVNDVTAFYKSQGESYMNASNLGENAPATQILIDLHREITDKAKPMYDQVKRLLRVAESFIVGGHYDSPTIQSMAGNLHVQWETFMDRLDRRTKYLQMAFDFYTRAGEAVKRLEQIDMQLSAHSRQAESTAKLAMLHASLAQEILETVSPPLHDGYILIDLIGRGKPQLAGIEQKVDELEGWKKDLEERCQAHLEDAQQKGEMFLVFQERHAHLFTWLTGVVDTFLAMHADMGTILPAALEFLSNHERLEKDMKVRDDPQLDTERAVLCVETLLEHFGERKRTIQDQRTSWQQKLQAEEQFKQDWLRFMEEVKKLANEMDDLDELLKRTPTDGTKGLEIAIHRHDDQWKEVREAFTVMERKGREFLSEVKLVSFCLKRTIQDQRTSWQQKLQAEEQFKQDWLRFMEEVKKTIEWIVSLEREIFPTSGADLGTNLEDAVDLQDKLRKFMPTAEKTSDVVEGHVKTAEMLAARGETGPQKDSLIMDLLRVHQRFQARLAEYILLLEMAIAFFDNINKLNMLIDKADKDFKQTSPQDVKQVEDFLRQHEAVKKDVSKVFNHTTDSGERIVLRVRENDGVDAARVTVEQALTMLDMRRIQWLKEWDDHRRRLEQGIKMCQLLKDIEKLREQLSELVDGLQEFQGQLKEAKTSHTISIIMQKFEDFTSQVTTFRYRFEGLSGQVDEALKEGWDNLAPLLSKRKELRDQWQRFMQEFDAFGTRLPLAHQLFTNMQEEFDAFGTRLPLAHQLFTNMQEIEAWLVETTKMLFELEQQAKAVKTKEEAKALLPPVEQKAKEAEMQEGRCRYVSELSVRVHGKDEGEKATRHVVVQFHEVRETITYVRTEIKTKIQTLPSKHDLDMKPQIEVIKKVETPTQFALLSPPPPKKKIVPPSFTQKLTSAVVDEGSPFRFECRVEGDPTPAITWYKDNDNIASSSIYETAFINNVASLTIAEVFVEDEARYMCKASNPGGQAICSAKLTVKALDTEPPPQPPILNMNLQDIQVMEGEEITLVVKVTAYPQPDVYWFCDGQPVKESSGVRIVLQGVDTFSLVIKEAFPEDSGMYSVLAKNAHGEAHGSCKVTVERYAETTDTEVMSDSEYVAPTVYETLKDRDVLEGSKIRMDCVIIGTPEPEIIWYFKDKPLKESHNKMLLFEGDKCSLVINEARYSDRGEYKCVAINPAGKAETAMTLEVEPLPATDGYLTDESKMAPKKPDIPPVFVQNFEERIYYEGAEARLTCRVQGRPAPTVTWYKDDVQVVPTDHIRIVQIGDTHSVMFKHVGEEDYGIYMCVAVNRAGSVSRCGHVSLKGPGMEPPRFTQELADARGVEGTPVGLVCRVTGKPEPSVVFYRDGNVIHESEDFKIVIQGDLCSLLIPEVLVQDEGKYMARAVNPAGEATTAAVLRVEGEARPPTFIKKLDKQLKVKEGRVVMLEVMVDGCPKPKVKWFMDEEPVMSQDYDIIVDGGRHALTIKEVFDEDAGVFKCRAKNSQGEVTCTCQLSVVPPSSDEERERAEASVVQQPVVQPTVQPVVQPAVQPVLVEEPPMEVERVPEPPIIRNMEPPKFVQPIRSIAVVEGKRAEFEGLVTGDPQPEVTWYKDGQDCTQNPDFEIAYIEGHAKLVIQEVFDEDAGKYTCKAKNQAGTAASTAELVVKAVTEPPDFTQRLQSMQVNEGAEVRLEVRISGVPTPEIKWFREGAEIQTSHDFQIIREGDLSALVIREAFSEDSGKFSVMASNSVGRATSAAHLVITAAEESVAMEATTTEQVQITQAQTQAQQMDLGSGYEPGVTEVREAVVSAAARRVVGGVQYGEQTVSAQQVAVAEEEQRRAIQTSEQQVTVTEQQMMQASSTTSMTSMQATSMQASSMTSTTEQHTVTQQQETQAAASAAASRQVSSGVTITRETREVGAAVTRVSQETSVKTAQRRTERVVTRDLASEKVVSAIDTTPIEWNGKKKPPTVAKKVRTFTPEELEEIRSQREEGMVTFQVEGGEMLRTQAKGKVISAIEKSPIQWEIRRMQEEKRRKEEEERRAAEAAAAAAVEVVEVQMEVEEAQAPPPAPPAEPEAMETGISQPVFQKQAGQQQIYQQTHGKDPMQQVHQMRAMQQQVQNMQQQQQQLQPHQMQQMLQLQQQQHQMQQQQHQMQHQVQSTQHLQQPVFTMQQVEGLQQMAPVRTVQQLPGMQQQVTGMQQVPGTQQQHIVYQQQHATVRHNPGTQPTHFTNTTGYTTGYTPAHVLGEQMQPALAAIHPASVIHMGHAKERVYKAHPEEVMGSPGQRRRALIQLHEGIHADFDACIPYFPKALSDISAEEGECVIFECLVLGEPRPHVKWFREGAEIESSPDFTISQEGDVARLVISEVFIDDAGKFTCTALNEAGSRSCYCFLHVNAAVGIEVPPPPPPPPKVEEGPHDFVVDSTKGISKPTFTARLMPCKYVEGQTVIFKIPVDGNPRPEISWTFNGVKLKSGVRHMISYEMGFAMLSISMLLPEDCGEYAVTASSPSGQATQKARLMTEAEYEMWLREEEEKAKKAQRISLVTEMEEKFSASETEGEAVIKPSEAGLTRKAGIAEARIIESKISMEGYGEYLEAKKSGASPERGPRARSRSPRRDTTEPGVKEKHFRPQIVQRPEDLEVIEGQMARFDLKVSGRPPPDIQWFLNGQPVLDDATHKAVVNEGGIRSLLIIPATPDDSGEYTCVAVNRAGKASFTVRLNVVPRVIGERPEFLQRIQNVQVQEGAPAEMRTRIHGVPYPQIAWQKDGYTISERPGLRMMNQDGMVSLMFDLTDKEDDGWYTAVAFNSAGTVATRCKLTVIPTLKKAEPPQRLVVAKSKRTAEFKREEVTAISKFGEETVDEEDLYDKTRKQRPVFKTKISPVNLEGMGRAHFECRLVPIGDPNMKVEWLNNGQPIEAANRLQYVNEFGFVSMDYLVAYPRDTGIITCRATNQHGEAETSSRLVVKDVPGKIEETQLPEGMRGISKLTEYERKLRESTMRTYVDEAEPEFEKAPPEIVMPPEGCRVVEGEQAKFHCRITGHPQPKVRWYLNGTIIRKSKRFRVWYDGIFHFEIPECKTLYAGEVKVVAENSQGTAETVVPLEVQLKEDYRTILKTPPKTAADPDLRRYHRLKGREEITIKRDRSPGFEMPKLKKVEKVSKEKSEAELASVELQKKFQKRFEPGYYEKLAGMELKGITKEEIKIEAKPLKKREVAVEAAPTRAAPPPEKKPKKEPGMEEPKFIQKLQNQKLKPGEQCRFEARVSGKPEPRVSWFKNGAEITASERIQISRDGSTCVLSIPNPDHEDSGTYVCKADNAAGTASCTAFLLVPKVVELGFTRDLTDVTAQERDATAVFEADVNQEFTKPRWYKDGQEITMGDKYQQQVMRKCLMLVVRNVTLQDAGQYTCQVEKATSSATLTVTGLPLEVKKPLQNMEAMETGAVTFEIELSQDDLEHQWFHNGVALANSDRVQIKLHRHFFYRLTLKDLAFEDAGEYKFKCRDVTATAQLVVTERPLEVTRSLQPVTCYETETASFEVEISHEGIEVQWQRKGSVLAPSDRVTIEVSGCVHRLTISNVSQSDAGEYAVVIGDFRQTTQLTVEIRKLEFTRPLQNIKIFEKQTATFEVEINFSGVDVQWLKNGEAIAPSDKFRVHADQKVHRLEILNVTVDDSGEYSFVALDTKATATLYVDIATSEPAAKHVEFIRKIYEPVRCSPGETATFELEISEEDVEGQWFRNEVTLSTSDKYRFEQVGGVRRLYISNVSLEDQGDYSFVANDAQTSVTLYVEVKYVEFRRKPMETITVKPNEVATFEFEVTDQYKDVDVSWYRNEIRIETGEKYKVERDRCVHRLLIADTEQGDSGEYVFVAGETREVVTLYVEVTVDEETPLPDIQIRSAPREPIRVDPHDTAVLEIEISEEDYDAQWLHKDLRLEISDKYVIERDRFTHRLLIYDTLPEDAGDYVFVAGETRHVFTIYVETAHVEMQRTIEAFEVVEYQTATLQFEIDEDVSAVQWLHNDKEIYAGEKYQMESEKRLHKLSIINITQDDAGNYTLVAGEARYTTTLIVKPAELELAAPQFTQTLKSHIVEAGEPIRFHGTVCGHPPPQISWLKNGQPIAEGDKYKFVTDGNTHTLLVINAAIEDSAEYACVASNDVGMATSSAQLLVEEHGVEEAMEEEVRPPRILEPIQGTETREGEGAGFTCRIEGTEVDVTWYRNDSPIKPSKFFQLMSEGEYYVLNISEAFPEDAGTYKVVAVNPAGEDQCAADLAVEKAVTEAVKPAQVSPAFIKDLQNQTTPEGSSARFDCRIQGKPDPTVTWYKNGAELKESSDFKMSRLGDVYSLVIVECLPEDSGVIVCKAVNPAGQVQSQAQLTVQVDETVVEQEVTQVMQQAPTMAAAPGPKTKETVDGPTSAPNFTQALQGQTAVLGERAKFEAFVNISPDTKIIWLHNGVEIKGDPRHLIQVDRKTGRCVLIITKLQVSDSGDYTLQVLNALGETACTAQLLFQEKQVQQQRVEGDGPNFTKMLSGQVVEEGSTARMEVGVGGSPAPTVSWLFNGVEIKADQRRKFIADAKQQLYALVIEKVQPSDQGNYTCRAMNKFGEAGCTGQLFVQPPGQKVKLVQGEAPNFLQMLESKAAEEGSTARLEIVVSGNPEPKVSWYHNGKEIRPDQKRQLQYDQARHLHALVIQKVQSEDDGEYTVKVRNDFGEAACTSSLHTYPPGQQVQLVHGESPNFAQMLESQAVEEGTVAKLEIVTSGTPEPTVTWLFGGVELQADARRQISVDARSHRLVIQQVQEADSGEYTARVQNDFGIAACTAQILVYPRGQKVTIVQEGVQHVKGPGQATQVVQGAGQATQVVQGQAGQTFQVAQGTTGQTVQVVQGQAGQTFQVAPGTAGQTVQVVQGQAGQTFQVAQGQTAQGTASQVVQGKVGLEGLSQSIIAAGQRVQAARGTPQSATGGDQVVQVIQGQTVQSGQGIQGGQVTVVGGGQGMMVQGSQGTMVVQGGGTMVQGGQVTMVQGGQGTMVQGGTMVVQGTSQQSLQGDPPNFGKMPDSQAVEEGGTAKFETIVTGSPEPEVAWLHNGQELKSDGRRQISTDSANHHHVLVIQKLTKADAGKYTARVGNQFGEAACTAELHVVPRGQKVKMVKGESPNFAKMLDSQAVEDGGAARFEVVVTGNPEPTVIWQYNGQELEQDQRREVICNKAKGQHVLLIESVQQSDSGDYTARVRNDFGEAACTAQLLVYPPGQKVKLVTGESPNFAKFPSSVAVADGEPARFDAAVTGSPLPKVTWLHMGTEIQSDQRRKVLFDESKKTASIVISQVQPSDGGDYTCQLNNDYGQAACTAQLLVKEKSGVDGVAHTVGDDSGPFTETQGMQPLGGKTAKIVCETLQTSGLQEYKLASQELGDKSDGLKEVQISVTVNRETKSITLARGGEATIVHIEGQMTTQNIVKQLEQHGETPEVATVLGRYVTEALVADIEKVEITFEMKLQVPDVPPHSLTPNVPVEQERVDMHVDRDSQTIVITQTEDNKQVLHTEEELTPQHVQTEGEGQQLAAGSENLEILGESEDAESVGSDRQPLLSDRSISVTDSMTDDQLVEEGRSETASPMEGVQEASPDIPGIVISQDVSKKDVSEEQETVKPKKVKKTRSFEKKEKKKKRGDSPVAPCFSTKPKKVKIKEGKSIRIEAECGGSPEPEMCWFKSGRLVETQKRVSISQEEGKSVLEIHKVSLDDDAIWVCKAINTAGQAVFKVDLEIDSDVSDDEGNSKPRPKPKPAEPVSQTTEKKPEKQPADFHPGAPEPPSSKSDFKQQMEKQASRLPSKLPRAPKLIKQAAVTEELAKISEESSGVDSSYEYTMTPTLETIQESPKLAPKLNRPAMPPRQPSIKPPVFIQDIDSCLVSEGSKVNFNGEVMGNPQPDITWLFNDEKLPESKRHKAIYYDEVVRLTILHVTQKDQGIYTCKAVNFSGEAVSKARLTVKGRRT